MRIFIYPLLSITLLIPATFEVRCHPAFQPQPVLQGASNGNQLTGHIFDSSRRPISEIPVELLNDYYETLGRTRTDASGFFVFNNLSSGNFKVHVITSGTAYLEQTQDVAFSTFVRQTTSGPQFRGKESRLIEIVLTTKRESVAVGARATGTVFVQEIPQTAKNTYEKAINDLESGKKDNLGISELKEAIEIFPTYYMALERLGEEYVKRGEFAPAISVLTRAIEVYPRGYQSVQLLGIAYYNLNQKPAALEMFNRAVLLYPNSINSQVWLGIALRQLQKYEQAQEHLQRANEIGKGKIATVHWQLALLYKETKRYTEAADELELFLRLQPDSRDAAGIRKLIKRLREQS